MRILPNNQSRSSYPHWQRNELKEEKRKGKQKKKKMKRQAKILTLRTPMNDKPSRLYAFSQLYLVD